MLMLSCELRNRQRKHFPCLSLRIGVLSFPDLHPVAKSCPHEQAYLASGRHRVGVLAISGPKGFKKSTFLTEAGCLLL